MLSQRRLFDGALPVQRPLFRVIHGKAFGKPARRAALRGKRLLQNDMRDFMREHVERIERLPFFSRQGGAHDDAAQAGIRRADRPVRQFFRRRLPLPETIRVRAKIDDDSARRRVADFPCDSGIDGFGALSEQSGGALAFSKSEEAKSELNARNALLFDGRAYRAEADHRCLAYVESEAFHVAYMPVRDPGMGFIKGLLHAKDDAREQEERALCALLESESPLFAARRGLAAKYGGRDD